MVCEIVVLAFGNVIVAVTPPFGVAPLPVTVNWATPAVPEDGDTLLLSAELLTDTSADPEADRLTVSMTVQVAVYVADWDAIWEGAVHAKLGVLAVVGFPPVTVHA